MRRFNPEKELYKIQYGNKNKIIFSMLFGIILLTVGYSFALYQVRYSKRIIYTKVAPFNNKDIELAVYLDGSPSSNGDFPEKNSGYRYDRIDCDNGSTAEFNTVKWNLVLYAKKKDKCDVYFIKNNEANVPELYQGLIPIVFDANGNISVADTDKDWYNYDEKRWANAVLVSNVNYSKYVKDGEYISNTTIPMNDVLQMYVWIPRYKYQLFNVNNDGVEEQEIKIQFESGTSNTGDIVCKYTNNNDGTITEKCTQKETEIDAQNGDWYTHPAFTFKGTFDESGTELLGVWVGKFETGGTVTALTIKPNIIVLGSMNLSSQFNAARALEETYANNFNINKNEIDTHMMKNMEWGAMAYLTQSKYGRCTTSVCTEVTRNTQEYKTGYDDKGNLWYTSAGQLASTTGNMYGIYDTNGDAWEYVMGVTMDAVGSDICYLSSGFAANTKPNEKYYDLYQYDTVGTTHTRGHLGDATRETLKTFGNNAVGWYDDYAYFPDSTRSWFLRSGRTDSGASSGVFAFYGYTGIVQSDGSFRAVLTQQDGNE